MGTIYRAMQEGTDAKPLTGPTARTLGVRPNIDIPVVSARVDPGTGGMSAAPGDPARLPRHRRPPELGGTGKDPVWGLESDDLGAELEYVQDSPRHGIVGPAAPMPLDDFQEALARTAPRWFKVTGKKP